MRVLGVVGLVCLMGLAALPARAEPTLSGPASEVEDWAFARRTPDPCSDHCWTLDRLVLQGDARGESPRLSFALTGQVLAAAPQIVPLFGSASFVRLEGVREDGHAATIGFEDDHWYVRTAARHFTLTGTIVLENARDLTVNGPVNAVDAQIAHGTLEEGDHLTAVSDTTLHVDDEDGPAASAPAATLDVARSVHVGDTTEITCRVAAPAGTPSTHELTVPLTSGETVTRVTGAARWEASGDGASVVLHGITEWPVTVEGVLPAGPAIAIAAGATRGWLLVESDLDHEVKVDGDATPADVKDSPLPPREPTSRAFRLSPGQRVDLAVSVRGSREVLAAVIDRHARLAVLTAAGDLVVRDDLTYDNSALDVARVHVDGRAIFLGTDGLASRLLDERDGDVAVPLSKGRHTVRLESLDTARVAWLVGRLRLPMAEHELTASEATATIGFPSHLHPIVTSGGERVEWLVGTWRDAVAALVSGLLAIVLLRRRRSRVLAAVSAFGAWLVVPAAFVATMAAVLAWAGWRVASPRLSGWRLRATCASGAIALAAAAVACVHALGAAPAAAAFATSEASSSSDASGVELPRATAGDAVEFGMIGLLGTASTQRGVTPVELPVPAAARTVNVHRALVTRDRPFVPVVWYVTDALLAALFAAWLVALAGLAWTQRALLLRLRHRVCSTVAPAPPSAAPFR